ncbi:MAG: LPS export ABC transporter periplasmic protein LptC [Proteobacteria bacterium]|nr:LPS export ABC transporter periplasmic protein LptC [Pseudomonadota bacterium]
MILLNKISNKKIKIALITVIAITITSVFAVIIGYRYFSKKPLKLLPAVLDGTSISIERINQISTKNGIMEWSLEARSALYSEDKKEAYFDDLTVTFFTKDNQEIYLSADKGTLKTKSGNIEINGNVIIKNSDYILKTGKIYYDNKKHIIQSNAPVELNSKSSNLVASSMAIDLNTNKAELIGKVEGIFGDNLSL